MFGVVLWSDTDERKAVIWCEDHGDLAFYKQSEHEEQLPLDAGDWVQFDMTMDRDMRYAHNPRLVSEGVCHGLADALGDAGVQQVKKQPETRAARNTAEIIPFASLQKERGARNKGAALPHRA